MRPPLETAFLPAAMEVQRTPPSPVGRAILWTIAGFVVVALTWACYGRVDIVTVAAGKVIPSGQSKAVQVLELGTVSAIHVENGDFVEAGDVLISLDASSVQAELDRLRTEHDSEVKRIQRLRQLLAWLAEPAKMAGFVPPDTADPLLRRQWDEFSRRVAILVHEKEQKRAEKNGLEHQVDKLRAVLPIIDRQADGQRTLADQKLLAEQQFLETEQARIEMRHDLKAIGARVAELDSAISAMDARVQMTRSELGRITLEQIESARLRVSSLDQDRLKATVRLAAKSIEAPVAGRVQQLAVHHAGAVVTPAQVLMVIVPEKRPLEVEATLQNRDVGFVRAGQTVALKIDTFPFTKYGTIGGKVLNVSSDAVADNEHGLVYVMRILMDRASIEVEGRKLDLSPGMTVTVEAKTGTRRLIEFFLGPLLRYANESVRER